MSGPLHLPGDLSEEEEIHRMIRVNQAGEYGAARIYEGQLSILNHTSSASLIQEMKDQEQKHLDLFDTLMIEHRVRPTVLSPLWHWAGYGLGALTALMGEKAAMACTVAVEEVIEEHYRAQEAYLEKRKKYQDLRNIIKECRTDEQHHKEISLDQGAAEALGYPLLKGAIKGASKLAIWLSKRI